MAYFSPQSFAFLGELAANNDRGWFADNTDRFEAHLREPALSFIRDAGNWFEAANLPYEAVAKKVGGSLSKIHRDVRFGKDKTPYHTHLTVHFRRSGDGPAPALGLRLHEDGAALGAGLYGADTPTLNKVRDAIVANQTGWSNARNGLDLWGESLKTAPKGYDKQHPCIDDLRRKSFMATVPLTKPEVQGDLLAAFQKKTEALHPFNDFLAKALG